MNDFKDKVVYQIYPKSFMDSNGDGFGDLKGVTAKLDYLADLGVDYLWLTPFFPSPQRDNGYDVADYRAVDPRYGTMEDLEELIREADRRGIGLMLDMVFNHTSTEHEWFKKACEDPDGEYGKYFYIEDCPDGKLPCNWRSYFGGSVWEPLPGHPDKYYLHMFHKKQPDLNWENPKLREEIYKMINWWLDKGLAGFRIDAIINIKKALPWRDYPANRADGMCSPGEMLKHAVGVGEFLGEMRDRTFLPHSAFTAGEVFNEKPEELPDFIGDNGYFSTMFDFNEAIFGGSEKGWYDQTPITPNDYRSCCFASQKKIGDIGMLSNIIENHDEPRGVSRFLPDYAQNADGAKMLGTVSVLLRGIPFIYQGQEIGMQNARWNSVDEFDDISTKDQYRVAREAGLSDAEALAVCSVMSRDNARTPMQWKDAPQAGFTSGTPWLKVNDNYPVINVEKEEGQLDSVLHYYRKLIALRKSGEYRELFTYGKFEPAYENADHVMAYYRILQGRRVLVAANFGTDTIELDWEVPAKKVLLSNKKRTNAENKLILEKCEVFVTECK